MSVRCTGHLSAISMRRPDSLVAERPVKAHDPLDSFDPARRRRAVETVVGRINPVMSELNLHVREALLLVCVEAKRHCRTCAQ